MTEVRHPTQRRSARIYYPNPAGLSEGVQCKAARVRTREFTPVNDRSPTPDATPQCASSDKPELYDVETGIWPQRLRNNHPSILLIILEKSRHHTRESEGASVQGMSKLDFAIRILVSEFEPVGLV